MTEQNIIALTEQLIRLGLGDQAGELYMNRTNPQKEFSIVWSAQKDDDLLQYCLRFGRESEDAFRLKEYELTIRTIPLPASYSLLNEELMVADAMTNAYLSGNEEAGDYEFCLATKNKLKELHQADSAAAELFMFKYWPQSMYKEFIPDDSSLKQRYEVTLWVEANGDNTMTAAEAYQYIKQMNREHVIADELLTIAKNEMQNGNHFIAYNEISYFLDKPDMYFFKTKEEADEFSDNNISEYDNFKVIHARSVDELLNNVPYGEQLRIQLLTTKNLSPMNEKNYDYLVNQLKYTGFGEDLNQQLKEKLISGEKEFTLTHQKDYGNDQTVATLQFRRTEDSDMVFLNRYNLMLKSQQHPDAIKQTFFLGKDDANITLKEAYNLMSGRAVYKEGLTNKEKQEYKAWLQIDFKVTDKNGNYKLHPYNENYGFNLEKALNVHTIKELNDATQKERLMESMQRGNRQSVTMMVQGAERKLFIESAPRFKSLNIYDESGKRLKPEDLYIKQSSGQSVKQDDKKQSQKQSGGGDEGDAEPGQKKSKRRKQTIT
jgi:hypothetical protein